jgi:PAS domain S-box-containing protein
MNEKIKILFLEDNETDAELNSLELMKTGFPFSSKRVETRDQFMQALEKFKPDLILADYSMPSFNGMEALRIVQEKKLNIPFIFVTGSLGEDLAVETVKRGATDYVLKQNLSRLSLSIKHALQESEERKKVEETENALRESERLLTSIYNTTGDIIFCLAVEDNEKYRFISVNQAFYKVTGLCKGMVVGKMVNEVIPELSLSIVLGKYRQAIEENSTIRWEETSDYPTGILIGEVSISPVMDDKGHCNRLVGSIHDITKRKRIEDELQSYREHLEELVKVRTAELERINANLQNEISERKRIEVELSRGRNMLRTLIDSLPDEIYAKDNESRFIMANSHVLHTFKLSDFKDILGKTDFDLLPKEEALIAYTKEHSVLQPDGQMINYEEHIMDEDGKIRWLAVTKVPMRDREGRLTGLVGINRDITQFKQIQENLQEAKEAAETANRAKSKFLSSMSHEIRTPMNAILGFSELMLHDDNLTNDQTEWIKTINRSGEHLLALINDILEISRIEAGRITFNPSNFDLHMLLQDIDAMFRVKTEAKNLTFITEYSDDLPRFIETDEGKLRQIFINIVGNAVKFTEEGGIALRVRTGIEENGKMSLTAEVEDTGPGIDDKEKEILFQMFGQTETGIKEGGTGLGLAISQQYAKIMGGFITVKSKPRKETCFTITINILPGKDPGKKDTHKGRVIGLKTGESYRVLIADDREDNRKLLREMLLSVGFKVEEAEDGFEAIKKFKTWLPDIILMDMRMPVMDGYDAIRSIKSMNSVNDKKIPIIAVTASAFTEDRIKALEAGADAYLRKPFKENELFECIGLCLGIQYIYK